jgi:4-hydroxy-4-methyl-2-oxoglutarate aldolase
MKAKVIKNFPRIEAGLIQKFKGIPSSIISDCLNRYYAMNTSIKPIFQGIRLCGQALTVQSMSGNNIMSHLALTFAKPGDVVVVDGRGYLGNAVWGGIQTLYAAKQGVAGLVVDGAVRDVEEIRQLKFPVYCQGVTPAGPHKGWADCVNVPIQCGGIPVHPGDLIIGDDDGVAVVPLDQIRKVYEESMDRLSMEKVWIQKIEKGESSLDAVELRAYVDKMEIEFHEE